MNLNAERNGRHRAVSASRIEQQESTVERMFRIERGEEEGEWWTNEMSLAGRCDEVGGLSSSEPAQAARWQQVPAPKGRPSFHQQNKTYTRAHKELPKNEEARPPDAEDAPGKKHSSKPSSASTFQLD